MPDTDDFSNVLPTDDGLYPAEEENGHNSGGRGRKKGDDNGGDASCSGEAVRVDPMAPELIPSGSKLLKLKCDILLSTSAFKFNLRRYIPGGTW